MGDVASSWIKRNDNNLFSLRAPGSNAALAILRFHPSETRGRRVTFGAVR